MASRGGFLSDGALRRNNGFKTSRTATKQGKAVKRKNKKKPEWDNTVTDLKAYKASQDELKHRHEAHKSKNVGLTKQSENKENESMLDTPDRSIRRKQALLQEILYGEDKSVLAETDMTMSTVKDLFGDDPKKFLGFPNVTVAPHNTEDVTERLRSGPFADAPETPTHLSLLSDSIMRTPALNEMASDEAQSESSGEEGSPEAVENSAPQRSIFEPRLDLQRYRQFVSHESISSDNREAEKGCSKHSTIAGEAHTSKSTQPLPQKTDNSHVTEGARTTINVPHKTSGAPTFVDKIPSNEREQSKVKQGKPKAKSHKKSTDTSMSSSTSGLRSLEDLKKMVESLEDEIAEYEMETGRQPTTTTPQTSSFSGYTSSLIMAVTKLMRYLKESEIQRKAEAVLQDQILQGFAEQRTLVDALTNDIVTTQEQNLVLQNEFHLYKQNTDGQINCMKREMQVVLNSYKYHTIQSTIDTLHVTKPIPLNDAASLQPCQDHSTGYVPPVLPHENAVPDRIRTEGAFIPVTSAPNRVIGDQRPDNRGMGRSLPGHVDGKYHVQPSTSEGMNAHGAYHTHTHTYNSSNPITQPQTNITSGAILSSMPWEVASNPSTHDPLPNEYIWPNKGVPGGQQPDPPYKTTVVPSSSTDDLSSEFGQRLVHKNDGFQNMVSSHAPLPSQAPLQAQNGARGVQSYPNMNSETRDDSLVRTLIKDPYATRQLRTRLHGIALKQRNLAAMRAAATDANTGTTQVQTMNRGSEHASQQPSPHVHFNLPLEVPNKSGPCQRLISGPLEKSPSVSPIPHQDLDVPPLKTDGKRKEKHVIVNLPSVWSDVSSNLSL